MFLEARFSAAVFLRFLRRLLRHAKRKVSLNVDEHPVYTSAAVTRWVQRIAGISACSSCRGYSPDPNPDELLNQDVKANVVGRQRPSNKTELMNNAWRYLWSIQHRPQKVRHYHHDLGF